MTFQNEIKGSSNLQFTHQEFLEAVQSNGVSNASLRQILESRTQVKFIHGDVPGLKGETIASENLVRIYVNSHSNLNDVVSTFTHEANHARNLFKQNGQTLFPKGPAFGEYEATRREFLFRTGTRPSIEQRNHLWELTQKRYPEFFE